MTETYPDPLDDTALGATWAAAWSSLGRPAPAGLQAELLTAWLVRLQKLAAGSAGAESELIAGEAASMRRLAGTGPASRWVEFTETMQRHFALVEALNLDRRQVWLATMLGLQRMATG